MGYRYYYVPPDRNRVRFSGIEVQHLAMAVGILTLAFAINDLLPFYDRTMFSIGVSVLAAFVAVATGFVVHELAHKVVAVRYGCWAEFRADVKGLLLGLVTAFLGFIFAAPGAVYIAGAVTPDRNGKISVVGPLSNFAMGVGAYGASVAVVLLYASSPITSVPGVVWIVLRRVAVVNLLLGVFNMIPIHPLDGGKVFAWSKPIYAGLMITLIVLFVAVAFFL